MSAAAGQRRGERLFLVAIGLALANVLWQLRGARRKARSKKRMSTMSVDLQKAAKEHLWMHFTRMGGYHTAEVPIIVRGDGCYLEDANGKRYLDALAGLFSVNIGYSFGEEIGQAALEQMRELPFYTNWSYAHPRAIELAAEVAALAPGDLNRAFFCSGGSEAVESAWKLARQYYAARGSSQHRYKAIARDIAYHGTTMGALSITGIPSLRAPFEPLVPEVRHVSNTNRYHRPPEETEDEFTRFLLDELEQTIVSMGPETVCLVHMEPVQNAGGAFTPPEGYFRGVRELCDRYDILLSADEVITAFGRLGYWFGSERYDIRPDLVTCAKGLSSSYAAIGAVVATDRVMEPFLGETSMFSHGITFGGHPTMCAIALKNIDIIKREGIVEHVRGHEDAFRATLGQLLDLPIVGDLRGTGFFYALELVKDKESRETFSDEECERLLRGYLSDALFDAGLICRADDRGDPVIQISPPLVAGQAEFDEITRILGEVLTEAQREMGRAR
jgi:adenosylmethionine-8-amino-7-oxononanoate aminotransferase